MTDRLMTDEEMAPHTVVEGHILQGAARDEAIQKAQDHQSVTTDRLDLIVWLQGDCPHDTRRRRVSCVLCRGVLMRSLKAGDMPWEQDHTVPAVRCDHASVCGDPGCVHMGLHDYGGPDANDDNCGPLACDSGAGAVVACVSEPESVAGERQ